MITVTPQGNIYLCNVPLENDYKNQLTFTNAEAQQTYFNSKIVTSFDNYTYMKKDSVIKVGVNIDDIIGCNYLFYRNTGFTNRIYYCFITNKEYINENVTALTIETDVYQTWCFDMEFKKSFVEREHVNSDNYGEHTVPENFETGEYVYDYVSHFDIGTSHIVMGSTISPMDLTENTGGTYGGIISGVKYYLFENTTSFKSALQSMANAGKATGVNFICYLPDWLTGYSTTTFTNGIAEVAVTTQATSTAGIAIPLHPTTIDGYTPKNKKIFTFPYVAYTLSNNQGGAITYHLEDFKDNVGHTGDINIVGCITPGGSIRAYPTNYKLTSHSFDTSAKINDYGLTLGKFPVCSWSSDIYTNWLTQNGVSMAINTTFAWLNAPTGFQDVGVLHGIASNVASIWQHSLVPRSAEGNVNSGDVTYSDSLMTFSGYFTTIKQEYAKIIDNYWSMFGYKVNSVKVPNLTGRTYWNYVKTIDCNIDGDIPQEDMQILKGMFNKGVTLWHDPTKMYDYSLNNAIVTPSV